LGLVRFVDNCPWAPTVHGQLSMLHGHCPCNISIREKNYLMENVNIKWTMSMLHGQLTPEINTESFKMTIFLFLVPDIPNKFSTLVVTFPRFKTELKKTFL